MRYYFGHFLLCIFTGAACHDLTLSSIIAGIPTYRSSSASYRIHYALRHWKSGISQVYLATHLQIKNSPIHIAVDGGNSYWLIVLFDIYSDKK
jgi:hypothetical protein